MRSASVLGLAGGFAFGVRRGGGDLAFAVENGFGRPLFEINLPGVVYWHTEGLATGGRLSSGRLDFQFGCPPCAGWSTASAGLDRRNNPDHPINDGIRLWFAAVEAGRPAVACFESVVGCLKNGRGLWGPLARGLEELGYRWCFTVYDNQDCGVPQRRPRMLFWAWRTGGDFVPEQPTRPGRQTTREAIAHVTEDNFWYPDDPWWAWEPLDMDRMPVHRLLPYVEAGSNVRRVSTELWLEHYHEVGVRDGWPSFTYRRLHPERPAPVMMANALATTVHYDYPGLPCTGEDGHPVPNEDCRLINGRELATLMGYPNDFILQYAEGAAATRRQRQDLSAWLTQAVSPAVGMWTARCASVHLETPHRDSAHWAPRVWDLRTPGNDPAPLDNWAPSLVE